MNNQPLGQVIDTTYSGVVLTNDYSYTKDVGRAKIAFNKRFNFIYSTNYVLLIKMYCYIFFDYMPCRFMVLKLGI